MREELGEPRLEQIQRRMVFEALELLKQLSIENSLEILINKNSNSSNKSIDNLGYCIESGKYNLLKLLPNFVYFYALKYEIQNCCLA